MHLRNKIILIFLIISSTVYSLSTSEITSGNIIKPKPYPNPPIDTFSNMNDIELQSYGYDIKNKRQVWIYRSSLSIKNLNKSINKQQWSVNKKYSTSYKGISYGYLLKKNSKISLSIRNHYDVAMLTYLTIIKKFN